MNPDLATQAPSPWIAGALAALRRARRKAEALALLTKTAVIYVQDGRLARMEPSRDTAS